MTRLSSPYVWVGHESFLASLTRCLVTSKLVPPRDIPFHFFFSRSPLSGSTCHNQEKGDLSGWVSAIGSESYVRSTALEIGAE